MRAVSKKKKKINKYLKEHAQVGFNRPRSVLFSYWNSNYSGWKARLEKVKLFGLTQKTKLLLLLLF
jgi:hypothetical protein